MTNDAIVAWIAALESDFLPLAAAHRWADAQASCEDPPLWLLDLSQAPTREVAATLLWRAWRQQLPDAEAADRFRGRYGPLVLGFLFLRYKRGKLALGELLNRAGQKADATECGIDCSVFYHLLNEIDGGGPTVPNSRPVVERVNEAFAPYAQIAWGHTRFLSPTA